MEDKITGKESGQSELIKILIVGERYPIQFLSVAKEAYEAMELSIIEMEKAFRRFLFQINDTFLWDEVAKLNALLKKEAEDNHFFNNPKKGWRVAGRGSPSQFKGTTKRMDGWTFRK